MEFANDCCYTMYHQVCVAFHNQSDIIMMYFYCNLAINNDTKYQEKQHFSCEQMRLRSKNGKQRYKRIETPIRKKRWPIPIPDHLRDQMTGREQYIWEYFNLDDLKDEIEKDCPELVFNKRGLKLVLIRQWITHGSPGATDEFVLRMEIADQLRHQRVMKLYKARQTREALGISDSDSD